jgi:hypothetical protein
MNANKDREWTSMKIGNGRELTRTKTKNTIQPQMNADSGVTENIGLLTWLG